MKHTKIISVGYQYTTLIATCAVTYEDKDGDGLKEQFTVSCPTTVTNPDNIKLFFASTERYDGQGLVEDYEVRPIRVSIAGGIATIVGNSWLLVKPVLYEGVGVIGNPEGTELDASLAANYATNVDVAYWRIDPNGTTYETAQATLIWETTPFPMWASSTAGTSDPAAVAYAIGRVGIRDSDDGIVTVSEAYYDTVTGQWYGIPWYDSTNKFRPPDRVKIRYLSGVPLVNGMMNKRMSTVVARLSAAESPRRICACDEANRALHHWQFDLARTSGEGSESYGAISAADLNNPLGTRRGQVMAFKAIRLLRDFRGFST